MKKLTVIAFAVVLAFVITQAYNFENSVYSKYIFLLILEKQSNLNKSALVFFDVIVINMNNCFDVLFSILYNNLFVWVHGRCKLEVLY